MAQPAPPAEKHIRPYAEWLREQDKGRTHDELSEKLNALVAAVKATGRKGTLTLTVTVKPLAKNDASTVTVGAAVALKAPELDRAESLFFVDDNDNLTRQNPMQPELPLAAVPTPDDPVAPGEKVSAQ